MDALEEKFCMLPRAGSFYYKNLSEEGMKIARNLSFIQSLCRAPRMLQTASDLTLSGGYFRDNFMVIRFTDEDILYYGMDAALKKRYGAKVTSTGQVTANRADHLQMQSGAALLDESMDKVLGDDTITDLVQDRKLPLIFPYSSFSEWSEETMPLYGIKIDPDVCVEAIEALNGQKYYKNKDFYSYYGLINFIESPSKLFDSNTFMATSYTIRKRNLLSFTLRLNDVYGPVDCVMNYYRHSQSPKSLYYASAQAAGMAVIRNDCKVISKYPLHKGCTYITTDGQYDAPYRHNQFEVGFEFKAGTIIGQESLYRLYYEGDINYEKCTVSLDSLLPVKGLRAGVNSINLWKETVLVCKDGTKLTRPAMYKPTEKFKVGKMFFPDFEGPIKSKIEYWTWCAKTYHLPLNKNKKVDLDELGRVILREGESFEFASDEKTYENAILTYTDFTNPDAFAMAHRYDPSETEDEDVLVSPIYYVMHHRLTDTKCLVANINKDKMTRTMYMNLLEFLEREAPVGCVLLISNFKE